MYTRSILAVFALTFGCTGKSDPPTMPDVGFDVADTAKPDTRPALDTNLDLDTGAVDSATDTTSEGGVAFDDDFFKGRGDWTGPAGSVCNTVSKNPELAAPPLTWTECGVGCKRLNPDWSASVGAGRFTLPNGAALTYRDRTPHLRMIRGRVKPPLRYADINLHAVTDMSNGRSVAVGRAKGDCLSYVTVGPAGVGYLLPYEEVGKAKYSLGRQMFGGTVDWIPLVYPDVGHPFVLRDVLAVEGATAKPPGTTSFDFKTFARRRFETPATDSVQSLDERSLITHELARAPFQGVIYQDFDTGLAETIIRPEAGRGVLGVFVDPSTDTLVWAEHDGASFGGDPRLFVSPYSKTAAGIKRKRIASWIEHPDFQGATMRMIVYKGMALSVVSTTELRLIRLTDGATWIIKPPIPGVTFERPIYVDDNEVWVTIDEGNYKGSSGALRIARSTLGEPIPGKP